MILKIAALGAMALTLGGCPGAKTEPDGDARRAVLKAVGEDVILPTLEGFLTEARSLEQASAAYATARASGPATGELAAARDAFRAAFVRWQLAEVFQVGPAGATGTMTGGLSLRDTIYSWAVVNTCRVDTHLVDRAWEAPGFFDTALVTSTGLDVVEYLLFGESSANTCEASAPINANGTWAALSADELARRRADYAKAAAAHVASTAGRLVAEWKEGGFLTAFTTAGLSGSPFPTAQEALDQLFAALFYVDWVTKDDKLANPAGLTVTCLNMACPALAEAVPSGLSREALVKNLEAARALMHGSFTGSGQGYDALLVARGAAPLSQQMVTALDEAIASVATLTVPVDQAVVSQLDDVKAVHARVKAFTDLLKSQFVTVLNLRVPQEGAGDND
ncbi:MAG: imelysin family protein [Myxococcota bacterium]